jgi:hypothetical protein
VTTAAAHVGLKTDCKIVPVPVTSDKKGALSIARRVKAKLLDSAYSNRKSARPKAKVLDLSGHPEAKAAAKIPPCLC